MAFWTRRPATGAMRPAGTRGATLTIEGRRVAVLLADVDASGAHAATTLRPPIGQEAALGHPTAGTILATVVAHDRDGVRLRFDRGERAMGLALAVLAADAAARHRDAA